MSYSNSELQNILDSYLEHFPADRPGLTRLAAQLAAGEKLNDRRNFNGHITGSGIVLSPDKTKVLVVNHNLFQRWMQPGGHWESDNEATPLEAAKREAEEETGVSLACYVPLMPGKPLVPFYLETHAIPARADKQEPAHWHHDFRYLFVAANKKLHSQQEEVSEAKWVSLDDPRAQHISSTLDRLSLLLI